MPRQGRPGPEVEPDDAKQISRAIIQQRLLNQALRGESLKVDASPGPLFKRQPWHKDRMSDGGVKKG